MHRLKRICSFLLAFVMALSLIPAAGAAYQPVDVSDGTAGEYQSAILFTQDIHEHFLPVSDGDGGTYGGLARLSTRLSEERERWPDALTVDAGDFSMGSLFQSIYASQAPELQLLGQLGIEATCFGNHEFDYRQEGLISMLDAARESGSPLPAIVDCNYYPPTSEEEDYTALDGQVWDALGRYGVEDYITISRGGVTYALFGLFGAEADEDAPLSGMVLADPATSAQETVDKIKSEVVTDEPLFIICLSHCGTATGTGSEDEEIAQKVDGIDLIISGHSHVVIDKPIQIKDTLIVSGGCYTQYLGELIVNWNSDGTKTGYEYRLLPLGDDIAADPGIAQQIDGYQALVEEEYLSRFGYEGYNQVLTTNTISFDSIDDLYAYHRESGLGNLIADAYRYAVYQAEGADATPVDFALTACGVVRDTVPVGAVTVSDAFNISSLGIGADGVAGYPLISIYLTGRDLKNAFEVDASITGLMPAAQLYYTGMTFTYNPYRMLFNRVMDAAQVLEDGTTVPIENDKLYRVVTGMYCGQMLGAVKSKSFGLLSITPLDAEGNPIDMNRLEDYIVHDQTGAEVKEWAAIGSYLQSFGGSVPERYAAAEGRKVEQKSLNPIDLLKNCNRITFGVICIVLALILLLALIVRRIHRRILWGRRPDLRQRGGGDPYTGGSRHKDVHQPLPYSGLDNYKRGSRRKERSKERSFWTPSYKGKRHKK